MYEDIDIKTALELENKCLIDVRSPSEFREATIPGAVNIPLFVDSERRFIGIAYKEEGVNKAKLEGLKAVAPKLPVLVDAILRECQGRNPVVFCWRGGMRSRAVASVLGLVGVETFRLEGGYKNFRRFIIRELETYHLRPEMVVVDGLTGVGKTMILQRLQARGYPVLDLEGLAAHRGSVFGGLGFSEPRGQKMFDALLWERLQELGTSSYLLVEGESKRIGKVYLPDFLYSALKAGRRIKVEASMPVRVERIVGEYTSMGAVNMEQALTALDKLSKRLGEKNIAQLKLVLAEGDLSSFVESLLEKYYDPLYSKSQLPVQDYELVVCADDLEGALARIESYLRGYYHRNSPFRPRSQQGR